MSNDILVIAKIFICIHACFALFEARKMSINNHKPVWQIELLSIIAIILIIIFCILLITTNWNLFTIPKMLLFISVCLYICFKKWNCVCTPFWIGIIITSIALIISVLLYINNIKKCNVPDVTILKSDDIICAKDNYSITGSVSGNILYIHGSISEESIYRYYYEMEDGRINQSSIPADITTIYFIEAGEQAYLETVITTEYYLNNNNIPATRCWESSEISYNLYVPEESVTNIYEFDAE